MRLDRILNKIRRSPSIRVTRPITGNRKFLQKLEMRLDYILHRLRFASTVPKARHLVNHHRILVNGSVANKASFICKPSDIITVKDDPKSTAMVHNYFDSPMFERATPPDAAAFKFKEYQCFVSGLAPVVDDEALARAFMPCGDFIKAEVVKDPRTGKSKGFGFVTYGSKQSMKEAVRVMSRKYFNGGNLAVKEAASREKMDKKKGDGKEVKAAGEEVTVVDNGDGEKGGGGETGGTTASDGSRRENVAETRRKEEARRVAEFTSTLEYCLEYQAMQKRRDLISKMNESMRSLLF